MPQTKVDRYRASQSRIISDKKKSLKAKALKRVKEAKGSTRAKRSVSQDFKNTSSAKKKKARAKLIKNSAWKNGHDMDEVGRHMGDSFGGPA